MADYVINSRNFFIDSTNTVANSANIEGDNIQLSLASNPIECKQGEYARISLQSFSMFKSWYDINYTNNQFYIYIEFTDQSLTPADISSLVFDPNAGQQGSPRWSDYQTSARTFLCPVTLSVGDVNTISDLQGNLMSTIVEFFKSFFTTSDAAAGGLDNPPNIVESAATGNQPPGAPYGNFYSPNSQTTFGGAGDRLMTETFGIDFHDATRATKYQFDLYLYSFKKTRDTHLLLGGPASMTSLDPLVAFRTDMANTETMNTMTGVTGGTDPRGNTLSPDIYQFTLTHLAPPQRSTNQHVYLRCNLGNDNVETENMQTPTLTSPATPITSSDILARIPMQTEYLYFDSATGQEFFMNLRQKSVYTLNLRLSDSHNRPLPRIDTWAPTLGSLNFTCILRIDLLREGTPLLMQTQPTPNPTPVRFSNLLTKFDHGNTEL